MNQHTILAGAIPGEAAREALTLAVELARPFGARVVLAGVAPEHRGIAARSTQSLEELRVNLNALRDGAPHDVPVAVEVVRAETVLRGLHDLAVELDAQLIVLGPTHRGVVSRTLGGDLAADAIFSAPCGIAVAARGTVGKAPLRVGVAFDGSPESREALEWGIQLAERTGGGVRILRVLEPRHREGTHPGASEASGLEEIRRGAEQRVATEVELAWGEPATILAEAGRSLDVLVLGSRGQAPLRRTLLGSVSTGVLHHAQCPVVVLSRGVHVPADTAAGAI